MHRSCKRVLAAAAAGAAFLLGALPAVAGPVTIDYELVTLAAPSTYEYRYTVTNVSLAAPLNWFSIDFDAALFDELSLTITSVGLADWSQQTLAAVPGLPPQYDAYKTTGPALGIGDTATGFRVQFTWLGAGTPGSQAFTVYDDANLNVIDSGQTTAANAPPPPNGVPEPSTAALVLLALCGAVAARQRS